METMAALTRMTENLRPDRPVAPEGQFDPSAADNVAPLDEVMPGLLREAAPNARMDGTRPTLAEV